MGRGGPRLVEDYLLPELDNQTFGEWLQWEDGSKDVLRILWEHKSGSKWTTRASGVFIGWDKLKSRNIEVTEKYCMEAKGRFRSAMNKIVKLGKLSPLPSSEKWVKRYRVNREKLDKKKAKKSLDQVVAECGIHSPSSSFCSEVGDESDENGENSDFIMSPQPEERSSIPISEPSYQIVNGRIPVQENSQQVQSVDVAMPFTFADVEQFLENNNFGVSGASGVNEHLSTDTLLSFDQLMAVSPRNVDLSQMEMKTVLYTPAEPTVFDNGDLGMYDGDDVLYSELKPMFSQDLLPLQDGVMSDSPLFGLSSADRTTDIDDFILNGGHVWTQ